MSATPKPGPHLGTIVGGSEAKNTRTGATGFALDICDLDARQVARIELHFLAHGFSVDPNAPARAVLFEKRGPGGAVVDLAARKGERLVYPLDGHAFYGHGVFLRDRSAVLAVETALSSHEGVLSIRDPDTLMPKGRFPTYGNNPHDCILIDDGATLVVTNGGGLLGSKADPSLCFIDVASQKLKERVKFSDPKINAGHVAVSSTGDWAVCSAPRDGLEEKTSRGGVTLRRGKRKPERMKKPDATCARMLGESLSVSIHEPTGICGVTNPWGGVVTFWSLERQKLVRALDLEFARGITVTRDGAHFVIAHGASATLSLYDAETLERVDDYDGGEGRCTGSHVYLWEPPARAA